MQQQLQPCYAVAATPGWTLTLGLIVGPDLTVTLTPVVTITLTRPHTSIVQFICCERVLTMRKVRRDRRRTLTDRRWRCLLL